VDDRGRVQSDQEYETERKSGNKHKKEDSRVMVLKRNLWELVLSDWNTGVRNPEACSFPRQPNGTTKSSDGACGQKRNQTNPRSRIMLVNLGRAAPHHGAARDETP
jgi:hypothetical protein